LEIFHQCPVIAFCGERRKSLIKFVMPAPSLVNLEVSQVGPAGYLAKSVPRCVIDDSYGDPSVVTSAWVDPLRSSTWSSISPSFRRSVCLGGNNMLANHIYCCFRLSYLNRLPLQTTTLAIK
jgi:hypothetical protein